MQKSYLLKLYEIAEQDPNVLLLLADSGSGYESLFRNHLPKQIYDFGIAEENMVAAAAGMASCGKTPFIYTAGAFLAYRSMEFIRDDVCLQDHNVKLIGMGTGLAWSTLGPTHHTTEDLGILRSMPGLTVLSPSTPLATAECVRLAYEHRGPVYLRIGMGGEPEYYEAEKRLCLGKNELLRDGEDLTLFCTGAILHEAMQAAQLLEEKHISVRVIDVFSVTPFDEESVLAEASRAKALVTLEEHSIIGGLGSAVAETLVEHCVPAKLLRLGLRGCFAHGYGTHEEVKQQNGLDALSIARQIGDWYGKQVSCHD